jgi:hypothetical protein
MTQTTSEYPCDYDGYLLLERIGAGGMSEVDLACRTVKDASYVRFVVIKRMIGEHVHDGSFVRMFHDEARITAELHHENIAQVYDFGKAVNPHTGKDEYFLAIEYVPGPDLRVIQRRAIAAGVRIPVRFSLSVVYDVLSALEYAHTRKSALGKPMQIVHRDVNPRNVMLSVGGEVKLIDFGVALAADRLERTTGRGLKGKWAYMSPEQIQGNVLLDGRSDLFAVGLILHELIELRSPFAGLNEVQIMHRVLNEDIEELAGLGRCSAKGPIQQIHRRALARDRDKRYPTAQAMRGDVLAAAEDLGGLMGHDERAAYLRKVAPNVIEEISQRLRQYRQGLPQSTGPRRMADPGPHTEEFSVAGNVTLAKWSGLSDGGPGRRQKWYQVAAAGVLTLLLGAWALIIWPAREAQPVAAPDASQIVAPVTISPGEALVPFTELPETRPAGAVQREVAAPLRRPTRAPETVVRPNVGRVKALPEPIVASQVGAESVEPAADEEDLESTTVGETPVEPVAMGLLQVVSDPKAAQVFVDGVLVGQTPLLNCPVAAGSRVVRLVDNQGRFFEQTLTISPRQVSAVRHVFGGDGSSSGRRR